MKRELVSDIDRLRLAIDNWGLALVNEIQLLREVIVAINIDRKTESSSEKPDNYEPKICDTCRYYNSNIPCGSTPSACKEADKFAEEFVDGLKKLKPKVEPFDKDINVRSKDEPQMERKDNE